MSAQFKVTSYKPKYKQTFFDLNLQWIETLFKVEEKDLIQLGNPESCLDSGGEIFFVINQAGEALGTCALYQTHDGVYELAKMAVNPKSKGLGLGNLLMEAVDKFAIQVGAKKVFLHSNSSLTPALKLYEKFGFIQMEDGKCPEYERANIGYYKYY